MAEESIFSWKIRNFLLAGSSYGQEDFSFRGKKIQANFAKVDVPTSSGTLTTAKKCVLGEDCMCRPVYY